jgi:hypothetical protein
MADPTNFADLTISLSRPARDQYWAELRFTRKDGVTDQAPAGAPVRLDFQGLRASAADPEAYGRLLKETLFGSQALREFFLQSLAAGGGDLRLRILIDRSALELHDLRWEALRHPDDSEYLALHAGLPFSRFLYSSDWRQVELRQKGSLRALIIVANPTSLKKGVTLSGQKLVEVDVPAEIERARAGLQGLAPGNIQVLESREGEPGRVTQRSLETVLDGGFDILYLVCHGALLPEDPDDPQSLLKPFLILEKTDGTYERVDAGSVVEFIRGQRPEKRPRLVVLASCQSGGQGKVPDSEKNAGEVDEPERSYDRGALAALGPRLVEAGIPAVIAMQDNITMETAAQFVPRFFQALLDPQNEGSLDRAMAIARSHIRQRDDWWVPVLYLRLRGGLLWYEPGFSGGANADFLWRGILTRIEKGDCIPILGAGLLESLIGPVEEMARRWAQEHGFPLTAHAQDDLPQVAQYLATREYPDYPREQLETYLERTLKKKCKELGIPIQGKKMPDLLCEAGRRQREQDELNPYRILAELPFKIYINASPDNLLEQALRDKGRNPQALYFCWKSELMKPSLVERLAALQGQTPTPEAPLLYYPFGTLDDPASWVLSEDDYFEYLMWINKPNNALPDLLKVAWKENALLFLGFKMSDWGFRVLYRSILNEDRRREIGFQPKVRSVAVQIRPGDDNLRPEGARAYLTQFFPATMFHLFWGSSENFLAELWTQWLAKEQED